MIEVLLQFDFFGIFSNLNAYLTLFISFGGAIGAFSRKLSITVFGALLTYVYVVVNTDIFIFDSILYLLLFIIMLWGSTFVVKSYMGDETEAA